MGRIVTVLLVFVGLTALATLALYDNGRLALVWGDWVVEMSATLAVALLIALLVAAYVLTRLAVWLWTFPRRWRERRAQKRLARAEAGMGQGLMAVEHGDWRAAERALIKSARYSDNGVMYYLAAARMAHNQGARERRDRYLAEAREKYPQDYVTIALVEARLRRDEAPEEARALLQALVDEGVDTPAVLAEYADLLAKQQDWATLRALLPKLKRRKAMDRDALHQLEARMWAGLLQQAEDREALENIWGYLDSRWWRDPRVLAAYVTRRRELGDETGLAHLIEKALRRHWDTRLAYLYGLIDDGPAFERLRKVQKWLRQHGNDPVLLLTAGRLACQAQLWAQAQDYLRQSLRLKPAAETFATLARCYEREGEHEQAALTWQAGLEALGGQDAPLLEARASS